MEDSHLVCLDLKGDVRSSSSDGDHNGGRTTATENAEAPIAAFAVFDGHVSVLVSAYHKAVLCPRAQFFLFEVCK